MLLFAQLLHAFSFGAMHAASIRFVHEHFCPSNQGRAQALYSSLGFGLGGFIGALVTAELVDDLGYAQLFWLSAFVAALAVLVLAIFRTSFKETYKPL